jgi:DNA-binding response OmpR family regulator
MESCVIFGKRVLLVEPNRTNALLLEELLSIDHNQVKTRTNGMSALELLRKQEFDVLLIQENLVGLDAIRLLQIYRFATLHPAPVIFLSADERQCTVLTLKSAGAADVIQVPFNLTGLRAAFHNLRLNNFLHRRFGHSAKTRSDPKSTKQVVSIRLMRRIFEVPTS